MIESLHALWFHVIFTIVSGLDWMRSLCFCESSKWCLLNILSFPCEGARRWYWVYRSKLGLNLGVFVLNDVWIEFYCKYFTQEQWCSTYSYHVLCSVDIMDPTENLPYILQWDELCSKTWCDGSLSPILLFSSLYSVCVAALCCCSSNILVSVCSRPPALLGISKHETSAVQQYIKTFKVEERVHPNEICWINWLRSSKM